MLIAERQNRKIVNAYQPGKLEKFWWEIATFPDLPTAEQMANKTYARQQIKSLHRFFDSHGMDLEGPPLGHDYQPAA